MVHRTAIRAAAVVALFCAAPLPAHHSISMIETTKPIWLEGTVISYEVINPHVMITLDRKNDDGQVERWKVEGPILGRLARMKLPADFLKRGDVIEVCGFPIKDDVRAKRPADAPGLPLLLVHGHLLVMPDGRMRPWGPYGKLANCVRPNDKAETWQDFVNMDPMGREYWCRSVTGPLAATPSAASKTFMDAVTSHLTEPCDGKSP